jgi:hypothetical protein
MSASGAAADVLGARDLSLKFPVRSKNSLFREKISLFRFIGNFAASH